MNNKQLAELEEQYIEEMQDVQEDDLADTQEDGLTTQQAFMEAYGAPETEEKHNQYTFLSKAAFDSEDTIRTTNLADHELGRPLFNVRFLLDLHDIAQYYLNDLLKTVGKDPKSQNRIANYFWEKIQNITASGMSKDGFSSKLIATKKIDIARSRIRNPNPPPVPGGKR